MPSRDGRDSIPPKESLCTWYVLRPASTANRSKCVSHPSLRISVSVDGSSVSFMNIEVARVRSCVCGYVEVRARARTRVQRTLDLRTKLFTIAPIGGGECTFPSGSKLLSGRGSAKRWWPCTFHDHWQYDTEHLHCSAAVHPAALFLCTLAIGRRA